MAHYIYEMDDEGRQVLTKLFTESNLEYTNDMGKTVKFVGSGKTPNEFLKKWLASTAKRKPGILYDGANDLEAALLIVYETFCVFLRDQE